MKPATVDDTRVSSAIETFSRHHPELADAMRLAAEAEIAWRAYETAGETSVTYSVTSETRNITEDV